MEIIRNELKLMFLSLLITSIITVCYVVVTDVPTTCYVKSTYGFMCPVCGCTRAVKSLLKLDFVTAFYYNPYVYVLIVYVALLCISILRKKKILLSVISVLNVLLLLGIWVVRVFVLGVCI